MKKISIIIPAYNAEKHIHVPIESLKKQTLKEFEVIIVNDGSNDKTKEEIHRLIINDARFLYVEQINQGPGAARNTGIKHSTGIYVGFLDSDDYFDTTYLEKMYSKALSEKADIVVSDFYKVDQNDQILQVYRSNSSSMTGIQSFKNILEANSLTSLSQNKLFKRDLFIENNIQFPKNIIVNEDVATIYKLMLVSNKIVFVNEPLFYYVQIPSSSMNSYNERKVNDRLKVADLILEDFNSKNFFPKYKSVYINYYLLHVVLSASLQICKQSDNWKQDLEIFLNKVNNQYFSYINIFNLSILHKKKALALLILKFNSNIFKYISKKLG